MVRQFVVHTEWYNERGGRFQNNTRRRLLQTLNDPNQSDIAAISYTDHSDQVEIWYTKLRPFMEAGYWVVIPGFAQMMRNLEESNRQNPA